MTIADWLLRKAGVETRETNFTDIFINHAVATARGETVAGLSAAVETCSGWWGRAFESASIEGSSVVADLLRPHLDF